jgi:hypothetical protein
MRLKARHLTHSFLILIAGCTLGTNWTGWTWDGFCELGGQEDSGFWGGSELIIEIEIDEDQGGELEGDFQLESDLLWHFVDADEIDDDFNDGERDGDEVEFDFEGEGYDFEIHADLKERTLIEGGCEFNGIEGDLTLEAD